MMDERLQKKWESLKTQRDELRVQVHLAKSEIKDEWEDLEAEWVKAESKLELLKSEVEEKARDVNEALHIVSDELADAYHKIKDRLKDN